MIPVFVVDRPASLRILQQLTDHKDEFGILAHAYTSDNFKKQFADFSLTDFKIGDSGIYQKEYMNYEELFKEYEKMHVKYGIIKDFYRDPRKTLKSAKDANKMYNKGNYNFELIGVAQGNTVAEYVRSYKEQRALFGKVAIGGLLDKVENHVRMVKVKSDVFLKNVLHAIRVYNPDDDIFPLGVFNKKRISLFEQQNIWASDYKGWIFRYNREQALIKNDRFKQTAENIEKLFEFIDEKQKVELDKPNKPRLLILSCSKKKNEFSGSALSVYDGVYYRIVKNYLKNNNNIDVKIISAKYGLINSDDKIEPYDYKMTNSDARIYGYIYKSDIEKLTLLYKDVQFSGGKLYSFAVPTNANIKKAQGKIGQQLQQLKEWLYYNKSTDKEILLN